MSKVLTSVALIAVVLGLGGWLLAQQPGAAKGPVAPGAQAKQAVGQDKKTMFEAEAQVMVIPKRVPGKEKGKGTDEEDIATQLVLLKSPLLIERAIKNHQLQSLKVFAGREPVQIMIESLIVQRHPASPYILDFAFRGTEAEDCIAVLKAILQTYSEFLDEEYRQVSRETLALIAKARDQLEKQLLEQEAEYRAFREQAPSLLWVGAESNGQERRSALETKRAALFVGRAEIQGRLAWLEDVLAGGRSATAIHIKVNEWATRSGYDKLPEEVRRSTTRVEAYRETLKEELRENQSIEKALEEELRAVRFHISNLQREQIENDTRRNRMSRTKQLYDQTIKRLDEINLLRDMGGFDVRVLGGPRLKKPSEARP